MFTRREVSEEEVELQVEGSLESGQAESFQEELTELASAGHRTISLDLSQVPSINSTCIGKILLLRKHLAEEDRNIRISACSDPLYNTFQLIDLGKRIPIHR